MQTDNPPAFPTDGRIQHGTAYDGMTLRDYFAAKAPEPPATWWGGQSKCCSGYAMWNYQYADAMLSARSAPNADQ